MSDPKNPQSEGTLMQPVLFATGDKLPIGTPDAERRGSLARWITDPANPRPCPLVIHLPGGDLSGNALCYWTATQRASELGGPDELEIWPYHDEKGRLVVERAVERLVEMVAWFRTRPDLPRRDRHGEPPAFELPFGF